MKRKNLHPILWALIIVLITSVVVCGVTYKVLKKQMLQEKVADLSAQIENWNLYVKDTAVKVGTGNCGNKEFEALLWKANSGVRMAQNLDGVKLVYTPNTSKISNEQFVAFATDSTAICEAGGINPVYAYADKLLWASGCGGMMPRPDEPGYLETLKCVVAEETLMNHFK
jgi:hypothetical protein